MEIVGFALANADPFNAVLLILIYRRLDGRVEKIENKVCESTNE